jgi:hypothetical protein
MFFYIRWSVARRVIEVQYTGNIDGMFEFVDEMHFCPPCFFLYKVTAPLYFSNIYFGTKF